MSKTKAPDLSLYMYNECMYCQRVLRTLEKLGVEVELRNVRHNASHRKALKAARGRTTVPVLRINTHGEERWMPESLVIVDYLKARFGDDEKKKPKKRSKSRLNDWRVWAVVLGAGAALVSGMEWL